MKDVRAINRTELLNSVREEMHSLHERAERTVEASSQERTTDSILLEAAMLLREASCCRRILDELNLLTKHAPSAVELE